jgi:hypothetical protein
MMNRHAARIGAIFEHSNPSEPAINQESETHTLTHIGYCVNKLRSMHKI